MLAEMNRHVHDIHVEHRPDIYTTPSLEDLTEMFGDRLDQETVRIFVAELDGECVGYACASLRQPGPTLLTHADSFIALDQLAVAPLGRRHGVATALLEAVRDAGREAGCRRLLTEVWDFNEDAFSFYEAAGFVPMKRSLEQSL
ncbi:GNAT family N-acetyltransferase [Microbispora bryophytorum]|uniref:GNAT family N-acetyltransferase n=1 Tax=Microbispora bryophytorum TaxID=1460882 RepID=UPI0033D9CEBE